MFIQTEVKINSSPSTLTLKHLKLIKLTEKQKQCPKCKYRFGLADNYILLISFQCHHCCPNECFKVTRTILSHYFI